MQAKPNITYCMNKTCPFDNCWRNAKQFEGDSAVISTANFGGTCRHYMDYLADRLNGLAPSNQRSDQNG